MKKIFAILFIICLILLLASCGISDIVSQPNRGSTAIDNADIPTRRSPKSSSEYVGMDYVQAEAALRQAGFQQIIIVPVDDINSSSEINDGAVESVRINGLDEYTTSTEFTFEDEVVISYHRIPKIPVPMSLSDAASENYMDVGRVFHGAGFSVETDEVYDLPAGTGYKTIITANGRSLQNEAELPFDAEIQVIGHFPAPEYPVVISIEFVSNLLFNKYDVIVKLDDSVLGTLPHGEDVAYSTSLLSGTHRLVFENSKDSNVTGSIDFFVDSGTTVNYRISCDRKVVNVNEGEVTRVLTDDNLQMPYSASHYLRKNYQEVKSELEALGFGYVSLKPTTDAFWAPDEVNSVVGIEINNVSEFDRNQVFNKAVPVTLYYHVADFKFDQTIISVTEKDTFWLTYSMTSGDTIESLDFEISNLNVIRRNDDGSYTALVPGTATVTVSSGGHTYSTCTVNVKETVVPIESVDFEEQEYEVSVGSTIKLKYSFFPEGANYTDVDLRTSNDYLEDLKDGTFYSNEAGDTEVSVYQDDRFLGKCVVHATLYDVEDLVFEEPAEEAFIGETLDIKFMLYPETATAKGISVVSSDPAIAEVSFNERGDKAVRVVGITVGEAVITITTPNGNSYTHSIVIKEIPPTEIIISNTNPEQRIEVGTPIQLEVGWYPDNTTTKELTWSSSDNGIIQVDSEGNLLAVGVGTAVISATHKSGVNGSITLTVERTLVYKVEATSDWDESKKIYIGDKFTLTASVVPDNATDKTLIFTSDDESIAKVSDKGVVTATGVGTTTIVITSVDGPKKRISVTVSPAPQKFRITWSDYMESNNHVGNTWAHGFAVNGEAVSSGSSVTITLDPGASIRIAYQVEEDDSKPDVGTYSETIPYSDDLCKNGYTISTTVPVKENGGRYSGNYAYWVLTVKITPVN